MQVPITFIYFSNQYINQSWDRWDPINYRVPDKCRMLTVYQERRVPWVLPGPRCVLDEKSTKCHVKSHLTWILLSAVFNTSGKIHPRPYLSKVFMYLHWWSLCLNFVSIFENLQINQEWDKQVDGGWKGGETGTLRAAFALELYGRSHFASLPTKHISKLNLGMQNRAAEHWSPVYCARCVSHPVLFHAQPHGKMGGLV